MGIGPREVLLIVLVLVILFGAKRIPELAKGMGQGIKEFKRGMKDELPEGKTDEKEGKSSS